MKLQKYVKDTRMGHTQILADWTDQMRRPSGVQIKMAKGETFDGPLLAGESEVVQRTLAGLAQIAWDMGWRPQGLGEAVAGTIMRHKIPKP